MEDVRKQLQMLQIAYQQKEQELAASQMQLRVHERALVHGARQFKEAAEAAVNHENRAAALEAQLRRCESDRDFNEDAHVHLLQSRITELERDLAAARRQADNNAKLLDVRTSELRSAKFFFPSADDLSETEVLDLVNTLNEQIFQISATIEDTYHDRYVADCHDIECATVWLKKFFNSIDVIGALKDAASSPDDASNLVQVALQGFMVSFIHYLCGTWDFTADSRLQHRLTQLRKSITAREPQFVSGRWRSLCLSHIRTLLNTEVAMLPPAEQEMVQGVAAVLRVFGVDSTLNELCEQVHAAYVPRFREIVRRALDLRRAAGEMIVSCDLEVDLVHCGQQFDDTLMEDEWAGPRASQRQMSEGRQVLFTTALGLVRENEVRTPEDGEEEGSNEGFRRKRTILLKPKVMLSAKRA